MNKLEIMIETLGNDLMGLAKAAIKEYGFSEKWDSLPIEVRSYDLNRPYVMLGDREVNPQSIKRIIRKANYSPFPPR